MGINAHKALFSDDNVKSDSAPYLRQLTIEEQERETLRAARDDIRSALRQGFSNWTEVASREEVFEAAAITNFSAYDSAPSLRPKFRMQGSWSYHTLNRTTVEPPQEIDLDDGIFLPTSFLSQGGTVHPAVVSSAYFKIVERVLRPLCRAKGWELIDDKPSCVRVSLYDGAHVDLALYAIPDEQFRVLVEKAATAATLSGVTFDRDTVAFSESVYRSISPDQIMLAHREKGWMRSDPRKLEDWFQDAVKRHGEQLRRVCRYLKAWRDHHWDSCKLSSISLMACAVTAYDEETDLPPSNRDDQALHMVSRRLPGMFAGHIPNPVVPGLVLNDNWTAECRASFIAQARNLDSALANALSQSVAEPALVALRAELGPYFPADPDLLAVDGPGTAPSILTTGLLKNLGDDPDARVAVKRGGDARYG